MYEYEIYNERKNEHNFIYGRSLEDMRKRHPNINWEEWKVVYSEYID